MSKGCLTRVQCHESECQCLHYLTRFSLSALTSISRLWVRGEEEVGGKGEKGRKRGEKRRRGKERKGRWRGKTRLVLEDRRKEREKNREEEWGEEEKRAGNREDFGVRNQGRRGDGDWIREQQGTAGVGGRRGNYGHK